MRNEWQVPDSWQQHRLYLFRGKGQRNSLWKIKNGSPGVEVDKKERKANRRTAVEIQMAADRVQSSTKKHITKYFQAPTTHHHHAISESLPHRYPLPSLRCPDKIQSAHCSRFIPALTLSRVCDIRIRACRCHLQQDGQARKGAVILLIYSTSHPHASLRF